MSPAISDRLAAGRCRGAFTWKRRLPVHSARRRWECRGHDPSGPRGPETPRPRQGGPVRYVRRGEASHLPCELRPWPDLEIRLPGVLSSGGGAAFVEGSAMSLTILEGHVLDRLRGMEAE